MNARSWPVVLLGLSLAVPAVAGELAGVTMPESTAIEGKTLKLNGMGLRKRMMFKVYVAGLYLERPSKDPSALISSEQTKQMQLSILRSLGGSKITEAISEGFDRNSKAQMGALKARLERFNAMFPDVEKGDVILMTYIPGRGTGVSVKGVEKGTIEGKDFADALFAVWLGPDPVQEDLKKALLGGG
jgi:hypothetical protein